MYTVHQAKTNLSRLIQEAEKGHEVIIARGKTPVARIVPIGGARSRRTPGKFKAQITIKPAFFEPMTAAELREWGIE